MKLKMQTRDSRTGHGTRVTVEACGPLILRKDTGIICGVKLEPFVLLY